MKSASFFVLWLLFVAVNAQEAQHTHQIWHHADLNGIQAGTEHNCLRLWLEERTYDLALVQPGKLQGVYVNALSAVPLGTPGTSANCRYREPASEPWARSTRLWTVLGRRTPDASWKIWAEPKNSFGTFDARSFKAFQTRLVKSDNQLLDAASNSSGDGDQTMVFRRTEPFSKAARSALESAIEGLHKGASCVESASQFLTRGRPAEAIESCELIRRAGRLAGHYVGLKVLSSSRFDRVSKGFPDVVVEGLRRQTGIFFSYSRLFENAEIPGNAVVWMEDGRWRVVQLWL